VKRIRYSDFVLLMHEFNHLMIVKVFQI